MYGDFIVCFDADMQPIAEFLQVGRQQCSLTEPALQTARASISLSVVGSHGSGVLVWCHVLRRFGVMPSAIPAVAHLACGTARHRTAFGHLHRLPQRTVPQFFVYDPKSNAFSPNRIALVQTPQAPPPCGLSRRTAQSQPRRRTGAHTASDRRNTWACEFSSGFDRIRPERMFRGVGPSAV